ncbi:MAG: peptide deformylase [Treponema sp.]|jgi:peptide deformylase|nr:peptide deformylase [Treponema sp.]
MKILILGDELLRQKAVPVKKINKSTEEFARNLVEALHEGKGIGLAGPQVGVLERIFAVHVEGDVPRIFINPSILETSQELVKYEEGCLSIPGVYADVVRPKTVKVQAWNERGRPFTLEAGGILARVIQHEYDHLEGGLFIDRLSEEKRERILAKMARAESREKRKLRKV